MKRWLPVLLLILCSACASQSTPTPPSNVPQTVPVASVVPIATLLPTVTILPPTEPPATVTTTPASAPRPTSKSVAVSPSRYPAPALLEPKSTDHFNDGNDIKFVYGSVGPLKPNECYLLHVDLVNPAVNPGNRGDDFLDTDSCGDAGPLGKELEFVLFRGKFTTSPNYGTMLSQALALKPDVLEMKMTGTVRVVQNNGPAADGVHYKTVAVSPASPLIEFGFTP